MQPSGEMSSTSSSTIRPLRERHFANSGSVPCAGPNAGMCQASFQSGGLDAKFCQAGIARWRCLSSSLLSKIEGKIKWRSNAGINLFLGIKREVVHCYNCEPLDGNQCGSPLPGTGV